MDTNEMLQKIMEMLAAKPSFEPEDLLTCSQAAELFGVKDQTLAAWRHKGTGPSYIKIGSGVRYKLSAIYEFIDQNTVSA